MLHTYKLQKIDFADICFMVRILSIIILPFLFACKSSQNGLSQDQANAPIDITINEVYKPGDVIVFIVENNSDSSVYILDPSRLNIQRKIDSVWYDIRILPCPCGAPCRPPRYVELEPRDHMDINWNQKESWCEGGNLPGNDKDAYVKRGTYRFVLRVNGSNEKDQVDDELVYAEFKIL